jgi:hypothetical protein
MPMSTVTLNGSGERVGILEAIARNDRTGLVCMKCRKPVRPHREARNSKQAAHYEHLSRNPNCPLSDKR